MCDAENVVVHIQYIKFSSELPLETIFRHSVFMKLSFLQVSFLYVLIMCLRRCEWREKHLSQGTVTFYHCC
jgi:hypothetical protein